MRDRSSESYSSGTDLAHGRSEDRGLANNGADVQYACTPFQSANTREKLPRRLPYCHVDTRSPLRAQSFSLSDACRIDANIPNWRSALPAQNTIRGRYDLHARMSSTSEHSNRKPPREQLHLAATAAGQDHPMAFAHLYPPIAGITRRRRRTTTPRPASCCADPPPKRAVMRVCDGITCGPDGGGATMVTTLRALAPSADVETCGCLGGCGAGPNVLSSGKVVSGVAAALQAAGVIADASALAAFKCKAAGDDALDAGNAKNACKHYADAMDALVDAGELAKGVRARIGANWSRALLEAGRPEEAMDEARRAAKEDPMQAAASLREAQAAFVLGDEGSAEKAMKVAARLDKGVVERFDEWKRKRSKKSLWQKVWGS